MCLVPDALVNMFLQTSTVAPNGRSPLPWESGESNMAGVRVIAKTPSFDVNKKHGC